MLCSLFMQNLEKLNIKNRTVCGILIPASKDLIDHGYSHLLIDDDRGIFLVHRCRKSARLSKLNRTRVEIEGTVWKVEGEHPRLFVRNYVLADSILAAAL